MPSHDLSSLNLPQKDECVPSTKAFSNGGQFRIEIPSTEGPEAFKVVLEEASRLSCPVHRISQGSGIQMLSDADIREMARIGAERNIEVCLFLTPRAGFDIGGLWNAPAGKFVQWQTRGANQLQYCLDEVCRAVDLGIRSLLIADIGFMKMVGDLRKEGKLPEDLIIKTSAVMCPANPASCKLMEDIGGDTLNVATDLSVAQISAIRQVIDGPIDIYVEAPDGLGGFVRHHEVPDLIRYAAPIYLKLGLRNSPDIYPSGKHIEALAHNLSRERVRRTRLVLDLVEREMPEATMSPVGENTPDLGVPVA